MGKNRLEKIQKNRITGTKHTYEEKQSIAPRGIYLPTGSMLPLSSKVKTTMSLRRSTRIAKQTVNMTTKNNTVQQSIPVTLARNQAKGKEEKARKMDCRSPQSETNPTTKPKPEVNAKVKEDPTNYIDEVKEKTDTSPPTINQDHFPPLTPNTSLKLREDKNLHDDKSNLISPIEKKGAWAKTLSYASKKDEEDKPEARVSDTKENIKNGKNLKDKHKDEKDEEADEDATVCTIQTEKTKKDKEEYKEYSSGTMEKEKGNSDAHNDNAKKYEEKRKNKKIVDDHKIDYYTENNEEKYKNNNKNEEKTDIIGNWQETETEDDETICTKAMEKKKQGNDTETRQKDNKIDNKRISKSKKPVTEEKKDVTKLGIFRYRLTVNIPSIEQVNLQSLVDGKQNEKVLTNPDDRIHEVLKSWYKSVQEYDEGARLLTWSEKNTEIITNPDKIPRDPATRNKYFQNVRAMTKGEFRIFANVRVYSLLPPEDLEINMQTWAAANAAYFSKTLVQAEYCTEIGWLACTSQFSDPQVFKEKMEEITEHEWGFKLTAVTDTDKVDNKGNSTPWPKRIKALSATVPSKNKDTAIKLMNLIFGVNKEDKAKGTKKPKIPYADKYIFMEMEKNTKSCNRQLNLLMRQTQAMVNRTTRAIFISSIIGDIDEKINTGVSKRSLRSMIYRLKSHRSGEDMKKIPLFQDVYQVNDGSKFYINGSLGPKGPGHIFTFHKDAEEEACEMAEGLQVYLEYLYNEEAIYDYFSIESWELVEGWMWDSDEKRFIKPHDKKLENIINNHPMAKLFDMDLVIRNEKEKSKKNQEREQEHDKVTKDLLKKINNQSTENHSGDGRDDEITVITEHTCNTSVTKNKKVREKESRESNLKDDKKKEIGKQPLAEKTEDKKYLEKFWDKGKSADENEKVIKSVVAHKIKKNMQNQSEVNYTESIRRANTAIDEVIAKKEKERCKNDQNNTLGESESDDEETIATDKYYGKDSEIDTKVKIEKDTEKGKEVNNEDEVSTNGMVNDEESTVATLKDDRKETTKSEYRKAKKRNNKNYPDQEEESIRHWDDDSTIQTIDSNSYQLMGNNEKTKGRDDRDDGIDDDTLEGKAEYIEDDESEEIEIIETRPGKKKKPEKKYNVEWDMTHEEFIYYNFDYCKRKDKEVKYWSLENKLCYRASVMNSPSAHGIINENELKNDDEQKDYDELAEEYFKKFPKKLKDTTKVASNQKTGGSS